MAKSAAVRRRTARECAPRRGPVRDDAAAGTGAGVLPVVPVRARGLTVEGADGRRYLDCVSGAGALPLGHNHPVALRAIREVLDTGAPLQVAGLTTPVEQAFVEYADLAGVEPVEAAEGFHMRGLHGRGHGRAPANRPHADPCS